MKRPHHASPHLVGRASWVFISLLLVGCGGGGGGSPAPASVTATGTPGAEASVGERLFLETRFAQARAGTLRNGATQLQGIELTAGDATALVAFLQSLNEDYQ